MRKDYLAFFISLFLSRLADQILLFIVPLIVFSDHQQCLFGRPGFFCRVVAALSGISRMRCTVRQVFAHSHPAHQPGLPCSGLRRSRGTVWRV